MEETLTSKDQKESSFGIIMNSFKISTIDKNRNEIFHDCEKSNVLF